MKREIKFRGQRVDNGEWVIGNLVTSEFIEYTRVVPPDKYTDNDDWIVSPDTVGQFTGLLDKNGKEIYEGDIYRFEHPDSTNEVSYCMSSGFAGFDLSPAYHDVNRLTDVEVIGNIHDNPELLHPKSE